MKRPAIDAIIFDVGGTLRANQALGGYDLSGVRLIQELIGDRGDAHLFRQKIHEREIEYREWALRSLYELSEEDLWSQYLLPDYSADFVRKHAVLLNKYWRESKFRFLLPDAIDTLRKLKGRGYRLGIISNTTSSTEVPGMLREYQLDSLFSTVLLSTCYGRRKPHPSIFLEAAAKLGTAPERCAYIGDQLSRDLVGARQAGYGEAVIIDIGAYGMEVVYPDEESSGNNRITAIKPDFQIGKLSELLALYPGRNPLRSCPAVTGQVYEAALSTMWGVGQKVPFGRTFELARQAGFVRFELNHMVTPDLAKQWDMNRYYIQTIHDPFPAEYSNEAIKTNDLMISSLDEGRRTQAVDIVKRTIDRACELGTRSVVIHTGMVVADQRLEREQRRLFRSGQKNTPEFTRVTRELIEHRAKLTPPHLEKVLESMAELIRYCRDTGIELAVENRYHYYDIPILDEMQCLLDICDEAWYGYQYDSGHAHTLDVLGLCIHEEWLSRYGNRMIGAHLHDAIGIKDHQMPGSGDIDFSMAAAYIPITAYRTLEVSPTLSTNDLRKSLEFLHDCHCIAKIEPSQEVGAYVETF